MDHVNLQKRDGIATLILSRGKVNAIKIQMMSGRIEHRLIITENDRLGMKTTRGGGFWIVDF
jgi:hypothetical protein